MNTTGSLGNILAAWITYGTNELGKRASWSWRLPSLLQAVVPIFQILMVMITPESPRWLVYNGRTSEARRILTKYHAGGDTSSELLRFEMAEIEYTIESERAEHSAAWSEWFRTPENRHRFFVLLMLAFIIQWCGSKSTPFPVELFPA